MRLFAGVPNSDSEREKTSEEEAVEAAFRRDTIMLYQNCLDGGASWTTLIRYRCSENRKLSYCSVPLLTAPLNIVRTLNSKIQPTVALFTAGNDSSGPLRKQKRSAQWGQKVMLVRCDWPISTTLWVSLFFVVSRLSL